MIKYFYLVKFEYFVNDEYKSYFNLGIFSNLKLAKKKGVILSRDKEVKIRMILQKKLVG